MIISIGKLEKVLKDMKKQGFTNRSPILLSSDPEGNSYSPMALRFEVGKASFDTGKEVVANTDCLIMYPTGEEVEFTD